MLASSGEGFGDEPFTSCCGIDRKNVEYVRVWQRYWKVGNVQLMTRSSSECRERMTKCWNQQPLTLSDHFTQGSNWWHNKNPPEREQDRSSYICRQVQRQKHRCMWIDLVWQAENQPASVRTEQMLGDGPGLAAVTTAECVVSAERLMATAQIPLKSLLGSVGRPVGTESGSRRCRVAGTGRKWPGFQWSRRHLSPSEFARPYRSVYTIKNVNATAVSH